MDVAGKIACGPIGFALQYRDIDGGAPHGQGAGAGGGNHADQGVGVHVLGTVDGAERELLRFDCFRIYPHYHYGPMYKNERIYLDKTLVPDPFKWALEQFKSGKLPAMLTRAGYPTVAAALDEGLVAEKLREVEARAQAMLG